MDHERQGLRYAAPAGASSRRDERRLRRPLTGRGLRAPRGSRPAMTRHIFRRLIVSTLMTAMLFTAGAARGQAAQSGAIAQNASSHAVYLAMPSANAVLVLANKTMRLLTVLRVPASPSALAIDPGRHRLYVASDQDGMVSVFDTASYALLRIYPVGGHPSGLALMNKGRTLLVSDGQSGSVTQLPTLAAHARAATVFSAGPGTAPLLAPRAAWRGARVLAWARDFMPGETVEVLWGVQPLTSVRANAAGFVVTSFQVPANAVLTNNLVDFHGESSTTTQSAFMTVGPAPKMPKPVHQKAAPARRQPSLLQKLFAPSITLPIANPLAHPPAHAAKTTARLAQHGAGMSVPILPLAGVPLLLIVLRRLMKRRRKGKKGQAGEVEKGKRKGRRGAAKQAA